MRRGLGALLALLLAFAACNGDDEGGSGDGTTTVPTASSTTTPADPFAVPAVIDEAYAQRVIDKLYEIDGDAMRLIVSSRELVPAAAELLKSVYLEDALNEQFRAWNELIATGGLDDFKTPPGDVVATAISVVSGNRECVFLKLTEDATAVAADPVPPSESYLALQPKLAAQDPRSLNPTPWMIGLDRFSQDATPPTNPCAQH